MREILYRGLRLFDSVNGKAGEWIYGIPAKSDTQVLIIGNIEDYNEEYCAPSFWDPVYPKTVGQFTGLTDKNGKKIFEGDLVKFWFDNPMLGGDTKCVGSVFFSDNDLQWRIKVKSKKIGDFNEILSKKSRYGVEIIGNIHDKEKANA